MSSYRTNRSCFLVCLLVAVLLSTNLFSQQEQKAIIVGRVTDAESGEPMENVNVFLSFTTIGTSTDSNGSFLLTSVPIGMFDLVISRIGYERQIIALRILQTDSLYYDIKLQPQAIQEREVEVVAESPEEWQENLERFVEAFIGKTTDECRILNPYVLNFRFDDDTDTLIAWSDSVIRIENEALGYRVFLVLASFVWNVQRDDGRYLIYPRFEEIGSQDSRQLAEQKENREKSYRGSLRHFLKSLYDGTTDEELFAIYAGPLKKLAEGLGHRVNPAEMLREQEQGMPFKMLQFPGYLRVEYGRRSGEYTREVRMIGKTPVYSRWTNEPGSMSIITLSGAYALVDANGNLLNPFSIEVAGDWAKRRVAELLPLY